MKDPDFVNKLKMIQSNPQQAAMFMSDPKIQEAFQVMFSDMGFNMDDIKNKANQHANSDQNQPADQDHQDQHQHGDNCNHQHQPQS